MSTQSYRLTVVACALLWFLVGLHAPIVHEIVSHGRSPDRTVLAIIVLLVIAAGAALWRLLRVTRPRTDSGDAAS